MKAKKKVRPPRWGVQAFLNSATHEDRGWIKARISWNEWCPEPDIYMDIADCSRVITLDFSPETLSKKDKAARIRKLRRLQKFVNTFVEKAIAVIEAAEPDPPEKKEDVKNAQATPVL